MPLFKISNGKAKKLSLKSLKKEKELQKFVEENCEELLGVRFIASEFSTGEKHGGRIDTLGIDSEGNPTIIEYKKTENDNVINQGLFYLDWLVDHKGDFEVAATKKLGNDIEIIWGSPRLILIAQNFNKYDKYAVNRIGENISLYKYYFYEEDMFYLENVFTSEQISSPNRVSRESANQSLLKQYTLEDHYAKGSEKTVEIFKELREQILKIDDSINERAKKVYVAYTTTRNFAEVQISKSSLTIYLLPVENLNDPLNKVEKVPDSYNFSLNRRIKVENIEEVEYVLGIVKQCYEATL